MADTPLAARMLSTAVTGPLARSNTAQRKVPMTNYAKFTSSTRRVHDL